MVFVVINVILMVFLMVLARPGGSTGSSELENIQDRYMTCLRVYTQHMYPQQPTRFQDLLGRLPEVSFYKEDHSNIFLFLLLFL